MTLLKKMAIYFIGTVMSKLITVFMLPLFTTYINVGDYGKIDVAIAITTVIVPFCFIEIWNGVLRFMYDVDSNEKQKVFYQGFIISLPLVLIYTIFHMAITYLNYFEFPFISYVFGISQMLISMFQFATRGLGDSKTYILSGIVNSIFLMICYFLFIVYFNLGSVSLLISPIIANFLSIMYIQVRSKPYFFYGKLKDKPYELKPFLLYCIPLAINTVAYWALTSYTRIFLYNKLGAQFNGIYAIITKFTMFITLFVNIFTLAWQESVFEKNSLKSEERSTYYTKVLNTFISILVIYTSLVISGTKIIFPFLVKGEYSIGYSLLPMYYIAHLVHAISNFLGQIFTAEKYTSGIFYSTIIGAIVNLFCLYILTPILGLHSAPISLFFGFLINSIFRFITIQKKIVIRINYRKVLLIPLILIASILALNFKIFDNLIFCILVGFASLIIYKTKLSKLIKKIY